MPVLKNLISTKELTLPSGAKVVCLAELPFGDSLEVAEAENDIKRALATVKGMVQSWDFTDEAGVMLEVTLENIALLPYSDAQSIMNYIGDLYQ